MWRAGVVYDLTGDGRSALKASYGRYGQQVGMNLVTAVHPFALSQANITWRDANGNGSPEVDELGAFEGFTGGATTRYATPDGPAWSYSDEATVGVEHQLIRDLRVGMTHYHRTSRDTIGGRNTAVPITAYSPITINNPQGGTLTVYNLDPAFVGRQDTIRDNSALLDGDYSGIEITATKRFAGRWQMLFGFTGGRNTTGIDFGDLNDPNNLEFQQGSQLDDLTYQWRSSGTYVVPNLELALSGTFIHNTGFPRQYTLAVNRTLVPSLTRTSQAVRANRRGELRRPSVTLLDLRLSRSFRLSPRLRLEPQLDVFNAANAETVLALNDAIGPTLNRPSEILAPRIIRFGAVLSF